MKKKNIQCPDFQTIVDLLRWRATHQPERIAFTYLSDGETQKTNLTYKNMDIQARSIAAMMQSKIKNGRCVLLLHPQGLEFITAFFGCLYAGVIAIPANPPRSNRNLSRLKAIATDAQVTMALTIGSKMTDMERLAGQANPSRPLQLLSTDDLSTDLAQQWEIPALTSDRLAFVQYTSGSTGKPKGVMVSHGNLLHNQRLIKEGFGNTDKIINVGWLPLYHDMGLIGNILQSVYLGARSILMSPAAFIQKPFRWLHAISRYKATTSGGPDFAYDLCVQKITPEQKVQLELKSWEVAFNGAEPVRAETLERFSTEFASCGFRKEAFYTCYGMAEATLIIAGGVKSVAPVVRKYNKTALEHDKVAVAVATQGNSRTLVGCGRALLDQNVIVVDPETRIRCRPGLVGEIWLQGQSVAKGYWKNPEKTRQTFHAFLADTGQGSYLRTGDLGFIQEGELFIAGRLKDLIIIRGRNHYPQDIELTVEKSHPSLRSGGVAAFSIEADGQERLVVACEVQRRFIRKLDIEKVVGAIQQAVSQEHELQVHAVELLKPASIPKTSSGKIQRHACKAGFLEKSLTAVAKWRQSHDTHGQHADKDKAYSTAPKAARQHYPAPEAIEQWLVIKIAELLKVAPRQIDIREPFTRFGLDSMAAISLAGQLSAWLGKTLSPTRVYDYPTIESLARHLAGNKPQEKAAADPGRWHDSEPIAIIGMGCRFPGASNCESFWQSLQDGVDAVGKVPADRWDMDHNYDRALDADAAEVMGSIYGGFLPEVDQFDPQFFGLSPREAASMDPQHRLLLEVSWEALEKAGLAAEALSGSQTGVFIGISGSDYARLQFERSVEVSTYAGTGNALSIAANRLSYLLDLRGPSLAVDTACSSSLSAVHQACQSLRHCECDLAMAGGVNLILDQTLSLIFAKAGMLAADGRCKTFCEDADGYVRAEGCGIIVLKRLSEALRDRDNVLAIIKGSAVNQDGRSNGLTAPNGPAQRDVIQRALKSAGVPPSRISYVETHGTGTSLGDPIEVNSLKEVLMSGRLPEQSCWIGSVKTNIGHLEAAAGIAGLIKVVLCMQHKKIPPVLHLTKLNPEISIEGTPISIPIEARQWPKQKKPRLAGISAFGFGGTNAHVIVEEAAQAASEEAGMDRPVHLLTLSATTQSALIALSKRYEHYLSANPEAVLSDVCYTANTGRSHFAHRLAVVAESCEQLRKRLGVFALGKVPPGVAKGHSGATVRLKTAFLFTGQEARYAAMGRQLYETQPVFRQSIDHCDDILNSHLKISLLQVLYPQKQGRVCIDGSDYALPALFALQYALAELWKCWGIEPSAVMGHGAGEYAAACIAGVFSLEDGLRLVAARARLMQPLPQDGEMAAVSADASCAGKMFYDFEKIAHQVSYASPRIGIISDVTGKFIEKQIATPRYWLRHVRQPVRFSDGIKALDQQGYEIFLEIGPRPILLQAARESLLSEEPVLVPSLCEGRSDWRQLLSGLAQLYVRGMPVNWIGFDRGYTRRKVVLPTYPFQRQRYWIDFKKKNFRPDALVSSSGETSAIMRMLNEGDTEQLTRLVTDGEYLTQDEKIIAPKILDTLVRQHERLQTMASFKDWLYEVQWQTRPRNGHKAGQSAGGESEAGTWLIFTDSGGVGQSLAARLIEQGHDCVLVCPGDGYEKGENSTRTVNPATASDFECLFNEVKTPGALPLRGVVHLWSLDAPEGEALTVSSLDKAQLPGCASVLHTVQALAKYNDLPLPRLWLVTRGATAAGKSPESQSVAQSPLWGLGKVIYLEHPDLWGGMVDLSWEATPDEVARLIAEIQDSQGEEQIAFRHADRHVPRLVRSKPTQPQEIALQSDGTYLITGGLGALGLKVAKWLVNQGGRHLVLLGRRGACGKVREFISQLEHKGAGILVEEADVSSEREMARVIKRIVTSGFPLRGIIHAAGVLDDGILLTQTWERFKQIMSPKVAGTWNLHALTRDLSLDFFVCFSSFASLMGSPGQGNYASANAFMDALAGYRRMQGLSGISVNWGPWSGGGMATSKVQMWQTRTGVSPLPPGGAVSALSYLLGTTGVQTAVAKVDWTVFKGLYEARKARLFLEQIEAQPQESAKHQPFAKQTGLLRQLENAPASDRQNLLMAHLQSEVARILGFEPSRLPEVDQGFFEMGMDSLTAMELKYSLDASLGTFLPLSITFDCPTIKHLASHIAIKILRWESPVITQRATANDYNNQTDILSLVDHLPEDEIPPEIEKQLFRLEGLLK